MDRTAIWKLCEHEGRWAGANLAVIVQQEKATSVKDVLGGY